MNRSFPTAPAVALAALLLCGTARSQTFVDPLNLQQNTLSAVTAIESLAKQVDQLKTQARTLEEAVKAGTSVPPEVWAELDRSIAASAQQGTALIITAGQLEADYKRLFPGVGKRDEAQVVLDTLQGVLTAFRNAQQAAVDTQSRLEKLKQANDRAQGQLAAEQTSNALAALNAELLSRVQESVGLQTNALAVAEARRVQKEAAERAAADRSRESMPTSTEYKPDRDLLRLRRGGR